MLLIESRRRGHEKISAELSNVLEDCGIVLDYILPECRGRKPAPKDESSSRIPVGKSKRLLQGEKPHIPADANAYERGGRMVKRKGGIKSILFGYMQEPTERRARPEDLQG